VVFRRWWEFHREAFGFTPRWGRMNAEMSTEQLLHAAVDALSGAYREEPWASWAAAWSSGRDRSAPAGPSPKCPPSRARPSRKLEDFRDDPDLFQEALEVANSLVPRSADLRAAVHLSTSLMACNLVRCAVMLANPNRHVSAEETIIEAAQYALRLVRGEDSDGH
jgi:hypothetical protein